MRSVSELSAILGQNLRWHKSRCDCFVGMLLALFTVRTINLKELALAFSSKVLVDSRYKRLKRFFANFEIDMSQLACWLYRLFFSPERAIYLTIDRTNWYFGKCKINILMVGIAYEGIAIPIRWQLLNKAGNAKASEHIAILNCFVTQFGKRQIKGVLGDREFASGEFFAWLNHQEIPFYIRVKEGSNVCVGKTKVKKAKHFFNHLNPKEKCFFPMDVDLFGTKLFLAGSRSETGELMIVATNRPDKQAISIYLRRWEIECFFQALKGRGFQFEKTHITQLPRIERVIALLAVGFAWSHKVGEWYAQRKPIPQNKHRESVRPQHSFFRYGLNWMRNILLQPYQPWRELKKCINLLILYHDFVENGASL